MSSPNIVLQISKKYIPAIRKINKDEGQQIKILKLLLDAASEVELEVKNEQL